MDRPTNETALCQKSKFCETRIQLLISLETRINHQKKKNPFRVSITLSLFLLHLLGERHLDLSYPKLYRKICFLAAAALVVTASVCP